MRVAGASIAAKADALRLLSASNHPCKIVYINMDIAVFDDGFAQFSQQIVGFRLPLINITKPLEEVVRTYAEAARCRRVRDLALGGDDSARRDVWDGKLPDAGDHVGDGIHLRDIVVEFGEIHPSGHAFGQSINSAQGLILAVGDAILQADIQIVAYLSPYNRGRMNTNGIFHRVGEVLRKALYLRCQRVPCVLNAALEALHQIGADARPVGGFQDAFEGIPFACDRGSD